MARKRLNKNLVAALTIFGFVVVIVLSVLMLRQLQQGDPKHFEAMAQRAEGAEDWGQAALFYNKAWENSGDPAYLVLQGEVQLEAGEVAQALAVWQHALVNDPDLVQAHEKYLGLLLELAKLYGGLERWSPVHEAAEAFLSCDAERTTVDEAFARNANGLALINLTSQNEANLDSGVADLEIAVELAPDTVNYAVDLAASLLGQGREDEGEAILRELTERFASPGADASKARVAYAKYLTTRQPRGSLEDSLAEARRYLEESIELARDDPEALREVKLDYSVFLSQLWGQRLRDNPDDEGTDALFEEAVALAQECAETAPFAFDAYIQLANLYRMNRRHVDVISACEQRLKEGFSRKGVRAVYDKVSAFRLMILAAQSYIAQAVEVSLEGDTTERDEALSRAEEYLADADAEFPNHPDVLSQSGRLKLARGNERAALDDFRQADDAYRARNLINRENKLILARLHLELAEPGAAKTVLEEMWDDATGPRQTAFAVLYAEALVLTNELDHAMRVIDQVLLREPDNSDARRLKAAVYTRRGQHERAGTLIDSPTLLAQLNAQERFLAGDIEGAVQARRRALEQDPADVRLVSATVNDLLSLSRTAEARAIVERAVAIKPDNTFFKKMLVLTQPELSDQQRNRAILDIIMNEPDAYQRAWDLADHHMRNNNAAEALEAINEAEQHLIDKDTELAQNATAIQHRALLDTKLRLASELEDDAALEEIRDSAEKYNVDGAGGKSFLGMYHVHREELDLAISAFREAVATQSTDARSLTYLGQCLHRMDRTSEARLYYEQAIRVNPSEAAAHRGLAGLSKALGDTETYEKEMAICRRLIPTDPWVKGELLERQEEADPQAAIARRETLLNDEPSNRGNLFRLAALCEKVGDLPKGDEYWERLLALAAKDTDSAVRRNTVSAAAKYYRRTNRPDKSLELITEYADQAGSKEEQANAQILVAAHYLSQGDYDLVKTTLLAAADIAPTFEIAYSIGEFYMRTAGQPAEATEWFDRALDLVDTEDTLQRKQVQVTRITCLLDRSVNDLDAAQRYIEEFTTDYPDDPEGHLLAGEVHSRRGNVDDAVAALSMYLERKPDNGYALAQRAQHYFSQGRTAAAIEDLEALKRLTPVSTNQLGPRILLARLLRLAGRREAWINELESLSQDLPESDEALGELVRAYIIERRFEDADRRLTAQINQSDDNPDSRWYFLRGRVSLGLGDATKALADFQQGAKIDEYSADSLGPVLDAYLRMDRAKEGIVYYEEHASPDRRTPVLIARYARLLIAAGKKAQAVENFRRAMASALAESTGAIRAVTAELRSAPLAASEVMRWFTENPPSSGLARANDRILARLYRMLDRTDEAIATLEGLLKSAPTDWERADLLAEQAELYQLMDKPELARSSYEEALKYQSEDWVVLNNLAYVLSDSLGKCAVALPYAQRSVAIADNPATLDTLGWIYVCLEEYSSAVAELSRAIRLNPDMLLAYYHLGEAHRRDGRFLDAKLVLDEGLLAARKVEDEDTAALIGVSLEKIARRDSEP
ncbi:MAG: tetratricopeptide repeat protein [Phycisphaerales bacterium]|nr:MAG: tetratricopeptide repeat protein [Phycisphaerales bacterium]